MIGSPGNDFVPADIVGRPYFYERKDRVKGRYCVRLTLKNGKKVVRSFAAEHERADFAREMRVGAIDGSFSAAEWQRWLHLKATCERHGMSPESLLAYAVEAHVSAPVKTKPLGEVYAEFYDAKSDKSTDYVSHIKSAIGNNLVPVLGAERQIDTISKSELEQWLSTPEIGPVTRRNRRAYLRAFFGYAHEKGYVLKSPAAGLAVPEHRKKTPGILTPDQMKALMRANAEYPEVCAYLALGAFAGLRSSSIERLEPEEIRIKDRQLFFPAEKFKTGRSHLIEHAPENLWPWLERVTLEDAFPIEHRKYLYARSEANKRAGLTPPHNALRHSFATYKCALDGAAEKASYIMGHSNPAEIWQSYKGIATKAAAKEWFDILP
ncbi:MAG: hypothetical protein Q7Q73_03385 [Verrucomicrobiota bacterium JB024]|nr:hypothetical protein [Verrucomicrobiota bacterium JB024]